MTTTNSIVANAMAANADKLLSSRDKMDTPSGSMAIGQAIKMQMYASASKPRVDKAEIDRMDANSLKKELAPDWFGKSIKQNEAWKRAFESVKGKVKPELWRQIEDILDNYKQYESAAKARTELMKAALAKGGGTGWKVGETFKSKHNGLAYKIVKIDRGMLVGEHKVSKDDIKSGKFGLSEKKEGEVVQTTVHPQDAVKNTSECSNSVVANAMAALSR